MFKNVASQKVAMFAFDITTGAPKTGDAANITPYVSKDYGTVTVLGTTTATEMDATNAKGWYSFVLTQGETNADALLFTAKSSTSNISLVGALIFATPNRFSTLVIDAAGLADANAVKIGPTGAGTAQTARDIGASVLLSTGTGTGQLDFTSGVVKANAVQLLGTAWLTPGTAGTPDVNTKLLGGTSQTGRDIGASVLLSAGSGAGQLDFTSGVVKANATQWLGGIIPAVNVTGVPLVDLKYTLGTISPAAAGSVRADSVTGAVGSVTGAVGSVTGNVGGNVVGSVGSVSGAVGSVTGNVGGNVTGSVGSVVGLTASNLDATVSSRLATSDYTAPDNTSITAIKAKTDLIPGTTDGKTFAQFITLFASVLLGKASGLDTTTAVYRAADDSKNRVTATVDASGNRTAVTLDAS
jgi:hypothetical protein